MPNCPHPHPHPQFHYTKIFPFFLKTISNIPNYTQYIPILIPMEAFPSNNSDLVVTQSTAYSISDIERQKTDEIVSMALKKQSSMYHAKMQDLEETIQKTSNGKGHRKGLTQKANCGGKEIPALEVKSKFEIKDH
ncbi:hypothetical protein O181_021402 [Austropuccinia psidii MF-1]|uniref:Uncharacterized protein n=1 Tax=Austropuccinia psidii MF-1 TaxID=1389203 RepID=A0A9Q3CDK5_9BASI|nr:hypothetical protein [Austropuccinia psidii MF-1]